MAPDFDVTTLSHEQFAAFARRMLERAGVQAEVGVASSAPDEEEEELTGKSVSVLTDRPYEAWRVLTRQNDSAMERSGPSSITENLFGVDVTFDLIGG